MKVKLPTPPNQRMMASACIALGVLIVSSGLIINPWFGKFYRTNIINYQDVMRMYFILATVIGMIIAGLGFSLHKRNSTALQKVALLLVPSLLILLSDRFLLAYRGLPLWIPDLENHYAHRPNVVRTWGERFDRKLIRINQYGHHDDDFNFQKAKGEFRGLILGDSVTMGHGMTYDEAFPNQLEKFLKEKDRRYNDYQIINAAVQGYSTFHEYNMLTRSLKFEPDFIAIGFCMNDLSEPFIFDKRFGGLGSDYHGIGQSSWMWINFALSDTGYGRTIQIFRNRGRSVDLERRRQAYNTRRISQSTINDPEFAQNWKLALLYLDKIYDVAKQQNIRIVLMIFPYTFQLMNEDMKNPQRILTSHARKRNIEVIDFTETFEREIFADARGELRSRALSNQDVRKHYRNQQLKYFLDQGHLTVEGHRIVAQRLLTYLLNGPF